MTALDVRKGETGDCLRVLTIDGGGVRGIIPAIVLAEWENTHGLRVCDYFDLIVGTSTGSILAAGIAFGIPAAELVGLYKSHCKLIFRWQSNRFGRAYNFLRKVSLPPHNPAHLRRILSSKFEDKKIDDAITRLCITSVDCQSGRPRVFKTRHLPEYKIDYKLGVVDTIMASCAAPTFFPSCAVGQSRYVDGGLWSNNPSLVGLSEMKRCSDTAKSHRVRLLSLGCGSSLWDRPAGFGRLRGLLGWSVSGIFLTLNAQSEAAHNMATYLVPVEDYLRVDTKLTTRLSGLDRPDIIQDLIAKGEILSRENVAQIDKMFGGHQVLPYTKFG